MAKYYFISDVHIGAGSNDKEKQKLQQLSSFFNYIKHPSNELFIVGDLFDFWFEYKYVVPSQYYPFLFEISKLIEAGVKVYLQPGNHDSWLRDFFPTQMKINVYGEVFTPVINSKKLYLFHGDGILKSDKGYRLLKKILKSRLNIFLYRWLHPDIGISLAKFMSHNSRQYTSNKLPDYTKEYIQFAKDRFNQGYDYVIMGHSHQPMIKYFDNKAFINIGDWIDNFSYGLLDENGITLNYWNSL